MHVELGPLPSPAAMAWINYAREVLAALREDPRDVPKRTLDRFAAYLDDWERAAHAHPTFRWVGAADADQVEYLVNALYLIGERVEEEAEEGRMRLRPPEADKFHTLLVRSVLDALAEQGPSQAQFVETLREKWTIARNAQ